MTSPAVTALAGLGVCGKPECAHICMQVRGSHACMLHSLTQAEDAGRGPRDTSLGSTATLQLREPQLHSTRGAEDTRRGWAIWNKSAEGRGWLLLSLALTSPWRMCL